MLKIDLRSYNNNSSVKTTSKGPGTNVVGYALVAYMVLMEGMIV